MALRNAFENIALDSSVKALGQDPTKPFYIAPSSSGAVGQNRFRLGSTGRVALNVAGNLRAHAINAATTDALTPINRNIQILRLTGFSTATGWVSLYLNPTAGLPGVAARRPKANPLVTAGTAVAPTAPSTDDPMEVRADTSATVALSGGVDTGLTFGVPAGERISLDLPPIILTPGQSMGISVPFAGAAEAVLSLYWTVV